MSISPSQLCPTWKGNVNSEFEELFIRGVFEAHHDSHSYCIERNFDWNVRRYVRPQIRWALIEDLLQRLAMQFGLPTVGEPNNPHTHHHRRVQSGIVVVTQSHIADRFYMPKKADFRGTLAGSPYLSLFRELEAPKPPDAKLFAILTHSERPGQPWLPDFVDVMFPTSATEHAGVFVKLFDVHANLVESIRGLHTESFEEEIIDAPAAPQLLIETLGKTGTTPK